MPSDIYDRIWQAVRERKQIVFSYDGAKREACPLVLGYAADGEAMVFTYQFAGATSRGAKLPSWRCFSLARVKMLQLRAGNWHEGTSHQQVQSCVRFVDVDANIPETLTRSGPLPFGSRALQPPRGSAPMIKNHKGDNVMSAGTPQRPDEKPVPGPNGPRTPYPVNQPPAPEPGREPDFIPGTPNNPPGQM